MTTRRLLSRLALVGIIAGAAIWLAFNLDKLDPSLVESAVRDLGPWAPAGHVVLFALGTIVFLPGAIFGLAGGLLFGPLWGTILNLAGATLGATAAFLVGRFVAADWVRGLAGPHLQRLIDGVDAEGWRFVAFVRLVPLFPFNLTNYALGLTRISLGDYVLSSAICMLPGTLAYTWLGYAGREAAVGNAAAIRYGLLALAVLAAVAFLPRLIRRLRDTRRSTGSRWMSSPAGSGEPTALPSWTCAARTNSEALSATFRPPRTCRSASCPGAWTSLQNSGVRLSSWFVGPTSVQPAQPRCCAMLASATSRYCAAAWSAGTDTVCRSMIAASPSPDRGGIIRP